MADDEDSSEQSREANAPRENDPEKSRDENEKAEAQNEKENNRPEDTLADSKTCPDCGAPVDDVRATCINCGYEYSEDDHEDPEAGNEFMSGSQVDDEGNELPDEGSEDGEDPSGKDASRKETEAPDKDEE